MDYGETGDRSAGMGQLHSLAVAKLIRWDIQNSGYEGGSTPFKKVANSHSHSESSTPDLIQALRETLKTMP
jgi:hypothetical protein